MSTSVSITGTFGPPSVSTFNIECPCFGPPCWASSPMTFVGSTRVMLVHVVHSPMSGVGEFTEDVCLVVMTVSPTAVMVASS